MPRDLLPDQHWRHACFQTQHPLAQLPKLPAKLMMAAQQVHRMGSTVVEWRSAQMQRIRHLASELQPVPDRWRKSLHPQVRNIIGNWRLPLMHVLAMEAGSEDLFSHSFVMPLKVTRPWMTLQELLFQAKTRNWVLLASVCSSGDVEFDEASLAKTKQELDAGVMLGPWPADWLPDCVAVVSRRFPMWEHHGPQVRRKCRNIDEMSESFLNSTVEDFETRAPRGIEHILALVRVLQHLFGTDVTLCGFTADFKSAYRQVAFSPSQNKFHDVAWWDCRQRKPMVGLLTALAFGSPRAPANWGRLVLLLMTIVWHHLLLLPLDYVDDFNGVEPSFSTHTICSRRTAECSAARLSWKFKASPSGAGQKCRSMSATVRQNRPLEKSLNRA